MKKAVIAFISLILILGISPVTANAAVNYEARTTAPDRSNKYYNSTLNVYSQTGYGMPNCVAYVYGRVYEMNDKKPLITHGNAGEWWGINKRNNYYSSGQTPKIGAVAVWSRHVAVVEAINDDKSLVVSESHYGGGYFNTKTVYNIRDHYGQTFYGYIYTYDESENEEVCKRSFKKEKEPVDIDCESAFEKIKLGDNENEVLLIDENLPQSKTMYKYLRDDASSSLFNLLRMRLLY